jgi:hypothetical protein
MTRHTSSITSVSWIPSEAIRGLTRLPFDSGFAHYDPPPPDVLSDLDALYSQGAFRFANRLDAWIDVEDGRIIDFGSGGRSLISSTVTRVGSMKVAFCPTAFPEIIPPAEAGNASVTFRRTAGGTAGIPAPRHVRRRPFVQWLAPTAWTMLEVTLRSDGTSSAALVGASPFPRHWIYDDAGVLVEKSGLIRFKQWYRGGVRQPQPVGRR